MVDTGRIAVVAGKFVVVDTGKILLVATAVVVGRLVVADTGRIAPAATAVAVAAENQTTVGVAGTVVVVVVVRVVVVVVVVVVRFPINRKLSFHKYLK